MENKNQHLEQLAEIRSMMEQSSRFISLSGLSGVFSGIVALVGALIVFWRFKFRLFPHYEEVYNQYGQIKADYLLFLITVASVVLIIALFLGIFFTTQKAKKQGQKIWTSASKRMLTNLGIPLATGGLFSLALIYHHQAHLVGSATLIFYGLSLLNASKYTLNDIRFLGICEIILGLISAVITGYSLLFWAIGFGVLHIVYGLLMYNKYERG